MKTLCTFTRVAELRRALPTHDPVTLVFTPEEVNTMPFSFLAFEGGQGVMVDATPNTMMQPKQWTVSRAEMDRSLAALEGSRVVTVADEHGALVMTAGTQSVMLSSLTPAHRPAPTLPVIRPLSPHPAVAAPPSADVRTQTQAFKILEAALRLSAASNGAPILERCAQGYQIIISDVMGYQFDTSQPDGTVITLVAGNSRKMTRYPALKAQEGETLLQLWKTLGAVSLRRNHEVRP